DLVAVTVAHLVAAAVALRALRRTVELSGDRSLGALRRVQAESHRSTAVSPGDDLHLLGHGRDDGELGVRGELARARAGEAGLVAGVLDDHALQSEAQAERGDLVVTRELERSELAFDPADAESTWNADSVEV